MLEVAALCGFRDGGVTPQGEDFGAQFGAGGAEEVGFLTEYQD